MDKGIRKLYERLSVALAMRDCESCGGPAQHVDPDGATFCFECTEGVESDGTPIPYPGMGKEERTC